MIRWVDVCMKGGAVFELVWICVVTIEPVRQPLYPSLS
jgi:hypothetical protein